MLATTAALIKGAVLEPTLDAIAAGDEERALIYRPDTPQIDSLIECWQQLGALCMRVAKANGVQMQFERAVAGFADDLTRDLRHIELQGASSAPSNKELGRTLCRLLDLLSDPARLQDQPAGRQELHDLFAGTPRVVLFRDAVRREIGARRSEQLLESYRRWERARARSDREAQR
jgi:hypothetical protein